MSEVEINSGRVIRPALSVDTAAIARIYNHYVLNTVVTFEEQIVSTAQMGARIDAVAAVSFPWLVLAHPDQIVGYAYASRWNTRSAYRYAAECTIYLDPAATGQGAGTALYDALFATLRTKQMHTVIGVIALPNAASVALHEKFGLEQVGHFKEVGFKFGQWVDVGYWQVVLNAAQPG